MKFKIIYVALIILAFSSCTKRFDEINRNLELSISTETIPSLDYEISKKYLIIILMVIVLVWIITLF